MIQITENDFILTKSKELEYGFSFIRLDPMVFKEKFEGLKLFYSGNQTLDDFINNEAHRHAECITYVYYKKDEKIPVGFCSLCCSSILVDDEIDGVNYCIAHPAIEFRYFAVRNDCRGKLIEGTKDKISTYLFRKSMAYATIIAKNIMAAEYFVLHAANETNVRRFYKENFFNEFPENMRNIGDITLEHCVPAFLKIS